MSLKDRARHWIAARHGGAVAARLARVAEQYLNAYDNVANWDMRRNGELRALQGALAAFPGDVIDAGANVGQWASAVAPFARGRTVHSFEPIPALCAELARATASFGNVRAVEAGLGRAAATVTLHYTPRSPTITSAYPLIWDDDMAEPVACRIVTGDAYLAAEGIDAVALLKIDVEGMEAEVIAGFEQAFAARRIATVQFEHGPAHVHSGHPLGYFVTLFERLDFRIFAIHPRRLVPFRYDILREDYRGRNFFAVRADLAESFGG